MEQLNQEIEPQKSIEVHPVTEVKPFSRYFARDLDVWIFSFPGFYILHNTIRNINKITDLLIGIVLTAFVILIIEPVVISQFGTTLGKWAFGINLTKNTGEKLTYKECLKRSYLVWLKGYGVDIPVVSFITILNAYEKLEKDGITSWDKECGIKVEHSKRKIIPIIILFLIQIGSVFIL